MPAGAPPIPDRAFAFGGFSLYVGQKLLLEDGHPVRLGSRALDILTALIERAGEVVTKDELVTIVWPRTIVEESSLRVHVAALRKVLGDGQAGARYIVNTPGRGYSFVAPVRRIAGRAEAPAAPPADAHFGRLPARLTRMIGRSESVLLLTAQLKFGRFVTIVGPGGIGKTTMALAVAEAQGSAFEGHVCYIDLAPIGPGPMFHSAVMAGLGLSPLSESLDMLDQHLRQQRLLIVFDNCDHLIELLTPMVEHMLRNAPGLHVLATSREPMRAEGEWLHRLGALSTAPAERPLTAGEALQYPAIELFVERAMASVDDFVLTDADAALVGELCRRLDGNPLAIELAASRVDLFGLHGLAAQLDTHVLQLKRDRRDAPSRHHSLAAMLDWSYRLLTARERLTLNRLALFQGWFPLQAATDFVRAVEPDTPLDEQEIFDAIADLTAKSLLTSDTSGEVVQFRLLELTRAFALAQLDQAGQRTALARQHAQHVQHLVEGAALEWNVGHKSHWLANNLWLVDEMRATLAWCFGDDGDVLTGCRLTTQLWSLVNVVNPFDRPDAIERAIAALARLPEPHPELETRLQIALAINCELVQRRPIEASRASTQAQTLAVALDHPALEAETHMANCILHMGRGDYAEATRAHELLTQAARRSGSPQTMLGADRFGAQVSHFAGAHARCRRLAERVLNHPMPRGPMGSVSGGLDHRVSMRAMLSRTLWIEGHADQAAELAEETFQLSLKDDTPTQVQMLSLCVCPILLWRGDADVAAQRIALLREGVASHQSGGVWLPTSALIPWWLGASLDGVTSALHREHLMTVHEALVDAQALHRAEVGAGWCAAEILRAWGERLLREGAPGALEAARDCFTRALALAAGQQAPAWELRAATSLARLLMQQMEQPAAARAVLEPVYQRFTEGFATADLRRAAALLEAA